MVPIQARTGGLVADRPPLINRGELEAWIEAAPGSRVIVGLTGPPGVGKSTLAEELAASIGRPTVVVAMDGFHLDDEVLAGKGLLDRKGAPETFDAAGFVALLERIAAPRAGSTIWCPRFDRSIEAAIAGSVGVEPEHEVVLVEGNYLLLDSGPWTAIAGLLDRAVMLELPDELRRARLLARHVEHGRSRAAAERFADGSDETNAALIASVGHRADARLDLTG